MPSLGSSNGNPASHLFSIPFRRHRRQSYNLNPPDESHSVIYLGNVLTIMAKGEQSVEKPLSVIWRTYNTRKQRREISMKLSVTRSGLKAETKQLGLTEYWAHRVTFCMAPPAYPRLFCWVYKHEGKRMKPELRCHAVLCKKAVEPGQIASLLSQHLSMALQEYKREKLASEKARKNSLSGTGPRRKLMLQTGSLNFRPPVSRSKSAPRLGSIDEEDEEDEGPISQFQPIEVEVEFSDSESLSYRTSPISLGEDAHSLTNSSCSVPSSTADSADSGAVPSLEEDLQFMSFPIDGGPLLEAPAYSPADSPSSFRRQVSMSRETRLQQKVHQLNYQRRLGSQSSTEETGGVAETSSTSSSESSVREKRKLLLHQSQSESGFSAADSEESNEENGFSDESGYADEEPKIVESLRQPTPIS